MADLNVDEWVHLVEETTFVVFEVGGLEVEVNVTLAWGGKDDNNWHFKDMFLITERKLS